MSGSELATIWMSRIAMNMPTAMATKPIQVPTVAGRPAAPTSNVSSSISGVCVDRRGPVGRDQSALAVGAEADARRVAVLLVPQLAGDRLVLLVEPLAVVGVLAGAHRRALAERQLAEPIGVGE